MNEWVGPGKVLEVDGKSVKVELEGRVVLLSIDKVKKKGIYELKEMEETRGKAGKTKEGGENELNKLKYRTKGTLGETMTDRETYNGPGKVPEKRKPHRPPSL